jgi:ribosomal-protein-alanine N-acetyltransferase
MKSKYLETDNLILRDITMKDIDIFHNWKSADGFGEVPNVEKTTNRNESEILIKKYIKQEYNGYAVSWAVDLKTKPNEVIGIIRLITIRDDFLLDYNFQEENILEISSQISDSYRGKGYATEAKKQIIKFAFQNYEKLEYIYGEVWKSNLASIKVNDKLGFRSLGIQKMSEFWKNEFQDIEIIVLERKLFFNKNCG